MKRTMKFLATIAAAMIVCVLGSCRSDEIAPRIPEQEEGEQLHTMIVKLDIAKSEFDAVGTRSVSDGTGWKEGDVVYLLFNCADGSKVTGDAVYRSATQDWSLSYNGNLTRNESMGVQAFFIDGSVSKSESRLNFTGLDGYYYASGSYYYPSGGSMNIAVSLAPYTSRIRFKGVSGTSITVGGIMYCVGLTQPITGEYWYRTTPITLSVNSDGYTPYIYGNFANPSKPELTVLNSGTTFLAECSSGMFQTGKSGWMDIPTANNHNGWMTIYPVTGLTLDKTSIVVDKGKTATLTATVAPANAYDKTLTWTSSDTNVATVSNAGVVTAKAGGTATITATSNYDSSKKATCQVAVTDAVDLGLTSRTLWANMNVGATSESDYGSYFAWGELTTKSSYSSTNYSYNSNPDILPIERDAARANWGGSWQMPTKEQFSELSSECTWTWMQINNTWGYKVSSKKNPNYIFLPAAGYYSASSRYSSGNYGLYWSKTFYSSTSAYYLYFSGSFYRPTDYEYRYYGHSIRPVISK